VRLLLTFVTCHAIMHDMSKTMPNPSEAPRFDIIANCGISGTGYGVVDTVTGEMVSGPYIHVPVRELAHWEARGPITAADRARWAVEMSKWEAYTAAWKAQRESRVMLGIMPLPSTDRLTASAARLAASRCPAGAAEPTPQR